MLLLCRFYYNAIRLCKPIIYYNIGIGKNTLAAATDNHDNIAIGRQALAVSANDADCNIAIGVLALGSGDVGVANNIAIGERAGAAVVGGAHNTFIGCHNAHK